MTKNECSACQGCLDFHEHRKYKCTPCDCNIEVHDSDDELDDFPSKDFQPYPRNWGFGCYPPLQAQPDLTQELLKALLASHETHIQILKDSHKRELEMLQRQRCEREKKS